MSKELIVLMIVGFVGFVLSMLAIEWDTRRYVKRHKDEEGNGPADVWP